jgi:hypothetical protein
MLADIHLPRRIIRGDKEIARNQRKGRILLFFIEYRLDRLKKIRNIILRQVTRLNNHTLAVKDIPLHLYLE